MNCRIKDATIKRYHYDSDEQLCAHLADFVSAYNFARCLETLQIIAPYEGICEEVSAEPQLLQVKPARPNTRNRDRTSYLGY